MDTGSTGFMMVCVMLVFLMTPALALFYGGLSRRKHVVNTMIMAIAVLGIAGVSWTVCGWSLAYGGDGSNPVIGGFDQLLCAGAVQGIVNGTAEGYPGIIDIAFQMMFACITMAIIGGSLAGRMKFGAFAVFIVIWSILVYPPLAHMVWGGEGSLIGDRIGALDFAGGDVVHISSGVTGLVLCLMLGNRRGFGMLSYRGHNVPMVALGAGMLWFGWFGFNAGSAFAADGIAGLALLTTAVAPAASMCSWMVTERIRTGKITLIGVSTGLVAGLVVITPSAGFVAPWAAVVMGVIVSPIVYFAISFLKRKIGYDDALDAFGCHGVGGIVGGILTGFFCIPELSPTGFGGLFYTGDFHLLGSQILGILVTLVFVVVADLIIGFVVKKVFANNLRVDVDTENNGLDIAYHGESAYPAFNGLD